ncbi:MAG: hypothetical protein C4550_07055 [Nitrospiraceae bacterium]|nr:MAG: hypothetical protein C4550_07055 [Nitrospiraceae bacterium]
MIIPFGKKFTASHLDNLIQQCWNKALNANTTEKIIFDLKETEWIALEELTFLFAWFRYLFNLGKQIYIELPSEKTANERKIRRLISLYHRWVVTSFVPLNRTTGFKDIQKYFNVTPETESIMKHYLKSSQFREKYEDKTWHRIIPFYAFDAEYTLSKDNLREIIKTELEDIFKLEEQIESLLNLETAFSPFENKTLSNIITTELFLNVLHHSFNKEHQGKRQCYLAVVLNNRMDSEKYRERKLNSGKTLSATEAVNEVQAIIRKNYEDERPEEERFFFKSNKKTSNYNNASYIEFTFLDFGVGIPATLRRQYRDDIKKENIVKQLSIDHNSAYEDSRILEYAFLLHSSRLPFDKNIEVQAYVPRGLYFLVDIVRRYSGMVIARSNEGKVIFDFSDNSKEIFKCVRFSTKKQKLPFFQGTMITIILPAKKDGILLNAVQHKIPYGRVKTQASFKYISIASLISDAKQSLIAGSAPVQIYNYLFQSLNSKLQEYNTSPSIVLLDFAGCDNSVIDQKIYYYLCNTPYINENTPAIILNPHDKNILLNVQKSMS